MFYVMQWLLIRMRNRMIAPAVRGCSSVVDVGCGHFPNRYATVCADSPGNDDEQRGHLPQYRGKGFVAVDLNQYPWPFTDKQFDFAICTQVLEHLQDPVRACAELSRIARAGYIEVPHWCVDCYIRNADPIHVSLCSVKDGALSFWNRVEWLAKHPPCGMDIATRFLMQMREIRLLWQDKIKVS